MIEQCLTGNLRIREHKRRFKPTLYVLQVEVRGTLVDDDFGRGGGSERTLTIWRDFTLADSSVNLTLKPPA